jgi:hypothetical protein
VWLVDDAGDLHAPCCQVDDEENESEPIRPT